MLAAALLVGITIGIGGYTFVYAKDYSYLTNDPQACANCHVMRDHYTAGSPAPRPTTTWDTSNEAIDTASRRHTCRCWRARITALLVNIFTRQQEARNPFYRVVELNEETTDPAVWGKNLNAPGVAAARKRSRAPREAPTCS